MNAEEIRRIVAESLALKERFFAENAERLLAAGGRIAMALQAGGKVLVFGNGGSAADAQHFAGELVGRFMRDRVALAALALTTDPSIVTAIGNDLGFEAIFRRQVEAHGRPGDVAIGITTSGQSPNVVEALRVARERGLVDHLIDVPHHDTARIQEVHAMVVHVLCQIVEEAFAD
jgi:D-sedoheptulose 7-phosphate isomerase